MIKKVRVRTLLIGGFFTLFFLSLIFRVYYIQVVEASALMVKAKEKWNTEQTIKPKRGTIYDRNGEILAKDAPAYTIAVNPEIIHKYKLEQVVVKGLADILKKPETELLEMVSRKKDNCIETKQESCYKPQVEVRQEGWKIDSDLADKVNLLIEKIKTDQKVKNSGIYVLEEDKRYYPKGTMAAHLLGYTNKEGKAVMGLEAKFDDQLSGTSGSIQFEKDRFGDPLPDAKVIYKPAVDGKDLHLTIDQDIQHYIEQALEKANEQYHPKSLMAIAVDPNTMEVLGMANMPTFSPGQYWDFSDQSDFQNHAVSSIYEPGSTFKIVTLAGAVQEGLFNPDEMYQSGTIQVPGKLVRDSNNGLGWGKINFLTGLKRSSNVAFVKLGYERLQEEKLKKYITDFGFGEKTNIDIPGEVAGSAINFNYPVEVAAATYGQGKVTVTAIQQIAAIAAIANGGKLMQPHVVAQITDPNNSNKIVQSFDPKVIRQVISKSTASQVSKYLEQVVSDRVIGTGRNAYMDEYSAAGKTGTSQKVINGLYSNTNYIISFIGFAPVENPRIVVCVIADDPDLSGDYRGGGKVAAPIFKEIVTQSLRHMGVPTRLKGSDTTQVSPAIIAPNVVGTTIANAKSTLKAKNLDFMVMGSGKSVIDQFPTAGTQVSTGQQLYIMTQDRASTSLPDLKGSSLRDALEVCTLLSYDCQVSGEGYVVSQTDAQNGGRSVALQLKPMEDTGVNTADSTTADTSGANSKSADAKSADNQTSNNKSTGKAIPPAQSTTAKSKTKIAGKAKAASSP